MGNEITTPRQARIQCRRMFDGDEEKRCLDNVKVCTKKYKESAKDADTKDRYEACLTDAVKAVEEGRSRQRPSSTTEKPKKKAPKQDQTQKTDTADTSKGRRQRIEECLRACVRWVEQAGKKNEWEKDCQYYCPIHASDAEGTATFIECLENDTASRAYRNTMSTCSQNARKAERRQK